MDQRASPLEQAQTQDGASGAEPSHANNVVSTSGSEVESNLSMHLQKFGESELHDIFFTAMKCQFSRDSPYGTIEDQVNAVKDSVLKLTAFLCGLSYGCNQSNGPNFKATITEVFEILRKDPLGPKLCDNVASLVHHRMVDPLHRQEVVDMFGFKFHKFRHLPTELRFMIWEESLVPRDRVLAYSKPKDADYFIPDDQNKPACADARQVALTRRELDLDHGRIFNYERDIFYLRDSTYATPRALATLPYQKIRYLALNFHDVENRHFQSLLEFVQSFEELEELTVVISETEETLDNATQIPETFYFREPTRDGDYYEVDREGRTRRLYDEDDWDDHQFVCEHVMLPFYTALSVRDLDPDENLPFRRLNFAVAVKAAKFE